MKLRFALALVTLLLSAACASLSSWRQSGNGELKPRNSPVQVGETAPDFTLEDQHNQKVSLSAARGRPTVLVFYRGYW